MSKIGNTKKIQNLTPSEKLKFTRRIKGNLTAQRKLQLSRTKQYLQSLPSLETFH